jgi:tetratricopeptide (TPR) repeat protein
MQKNKTYIEFVKEMRAVLTDFLGEAYAKEQCAWFWDEINNGISNTPHSMSVFQINLRTNIDLMITCIEALIKERTYLDFLVKLAHICRRHSETHLASDIYERILFLSEDIPGSEKEAGYAMHGLAVINTDQAKFKKAAILLKQAKKQFRTVKDVSGESECINLIGIIAAEKGDLKKAERQFKKALELIKKKNNSALKGYIKNNLGIVNNMEGNYADARTLFEEANDIYSNLNEISSLPEVKHNLGMVDLKTQNFEAALKNFKKALEVSENEQYKPILGITHLGMAEALYNLNRIRSAEAHLDKALNISHNTNDRLTIADVYRIRGLIQLKRKNKNGAESYFTTSIRLNNELNNELCASESRFELARLLKVNDREKEAKIQFNEVLKYYRKIKTKEEIDEIKALMDSSTLK